MPMSDKAVHVTGVATVNTGGWKAELTKRVPQGINAQILMLDLRVTPPGDAASQVITDLPLRYDEPDGAGKYSDADVYCGEKLISHIHVTEVH